ncbi:Enhancer of polycomb homolog 1 [Eumeta japonica]|uniref:Enhancer of polycomb homolog 1 n=1 Tax=Eumeta variegata TaxID=151549 RepID=A0A4C1Z762_EUMVA|nr:Enhancer of polycomb homolog 1 [Eumeta japonica]
MSKNEHDITSSLWQEQETPEYDMDSDDERWLRQQRHPELTVVRLCPHDTDDVNDRFEKRAIFVRKLKFEQMMDKLEKSSGQTVATLSEAKLLLERQDDLVIAVYDYWLNKRLKTQHPLILSVRTESRIGQSTNNPYLAFRRRTEKMQTRKNRKNDESSYEKMLKLRRDLARAASLLDMVARRERAKRDLMRLTALIAERRFNAADFAGQLLAEIAHAQPQYTAVSLGVNTVTAAAGYRRDPYAAPHYPPRTPAPAPLGVDQPRQREKRPHKRRPRRPHGAAVGHPLRDSGVCTSSEEEYVVASGVGAGGARPLDASPAPAAPPDDGPFAFTRKPGCYYELPTATLYGDPVDPDDATKDSLYQHDLDYKQRYTLTSLSEPYSRCVGFARRRMGRGGRVLLDRVPTPLDDLWPHLPFTFNKVTAATLLR